ncbi:LysM peptidoglycan-binding domain-containing protein [Limosilactobacillus gastricus]|uniref:Extracellular surface protein n=1 Tax=Limosilactobacillus gastricus DSM 16045 TaxID=1423749 RepID=A0A0R1V929_9LACO|nr:LysM domain-containing protein [Limosilactobacillus gastricus]KRM02018.1 Extracellular surface protein [Limosilactobacillus gastricus DSM 16045]QGF39952.1 LysM peptidoglycan-binding domain-containing protein [Limosilactobacillus gastricus]
MFKFKKKFLIQLTTTLGALALGVTAAVTVANADTTYTVKSGDTLNSISQQYVGDKSLVSSIVKANNISDQNVIYVGEQLTIPTDSSDNTSTNNNSSTTTDSSTNTDSNSSTTTDSSSYTSSVSGSEAEAKEWIAQKESSGSYTASNGNYYGRYQLSLSYLNGDLSASNQEKVADQYVASRYGSWTAAKAFWEANGWY